MNNWLIWFRLSVKRQLKRPLFVAFLVFIPLTLMGLGRMEEKDTGKIEIGLYAREQGIAAQVMELLVRSEGAFDFYISASEEELRGDVAARRAECGYIFGEKLKEKLDSGQYKRSITVLAAPSTVLAELSTEVVYSKLIEVYGRELLKEYSEEGEGLSFLSKEERWRQLEPLYDKHLSDGSTFSFEYVIAGNADLPMEVKAAAVFPVRGVAAVCVFIMGLFSAAWLSKDEARGLFVRLSGRKRLGAMGITASAPVALTGLAGLAALALTGEAEGLFREAAVMMIYAAAVTGISMFLRKMVGKPEALLGLIPFFAMASLAVCPVFADLAPFVPVIRLLRWFFPPSYYLWAVL